MERRRELEVEPGETESAKADQAPDRDVRLMSETAVQVEQRQRLEQQQRLQGFSNEPAQVVGARPTRARVL